MLVCQLKLIYRFKTAKVIIKPLSSVSTLWLSFAEFCKKNFKWSLPIRTLNIYMIQTDFRLLKLINSYYKSTTLLLIFFRAAWNASAD